jgi:hypothetical protein
MKMKNPPSEAVGGFMKGVGYLFMPGANLQTLFSA